MCASMFKLVISVNTQYQNKQIIIYKEDKWEIQTQKFVSSTDNTSVNSIKITRVFLGHESKIEWIDWRKSVFCLIIL